MPPTVHFIRHGQSTFNMHYDGGSKDPLHFDARLSPLGHEQVEAARITLAKSHYDLVITSPLSRAIQTAQGMFGARIPIIVNALHGEWVTWSCNVGRPASELSRDHPDLDFSTLKEDWRHVDGAINEHGITCEPEASFLGRVADFRRMILARPENRIAVVGHGDFFYQLIGKQMSNCELVEWNHADQVLR